MIVPEIVHEIRRVFGSVRLDGGLSLDQAAAIDDYGRGYTSEQFSSLPNYEITDDWTRIPDSTLDSAEFLAHLDSKGFRYYIPAILIRLLDSYDPSSMMTISAISCLYPKSKDATQIYLDLSCEQKKTVAKYLVELPSLVDLDQEHQTVIRRALRNYWSQHLDG